MKIKNYMIKEINNSIKDLLAKDFFVSDFDYSNTFEKEIRKYFNEYTKLNESVLNTEINNTIEKFDNENLVKITDGVMKYKKAGFSNKNKEKINTFIVDVFNYVLSNAKLRELSDNEKVYLKNKLSNTYRIDDLDEIHCACIISKEFKKVCNSIEKAENEFVDLLVEAISIINVENETVLNTLVNHLIDTTCLKYDLENAKNQSNSLIKELEKQKDVFRMRLKTETKKAIVNSINIHLENQFELFETEKVFNFKNFNEIHEKYNDLVNLVIENENGINQIKEKGYFSISLKARKFKDNEFVSYRDNDTKITQIYKSFSNEINNKEIENAISSFIISYVKFIVENYKID